ncbi:MAG: Na+/H+ antiporter subunit B [Oligoflexus sp.]
MNSIILKTASRFLVILVILFSIYSLLRGHNEPGGGFIGGLLLAGAYALYGLTHGNAAVLQLLPYNPRTLIGIGVCISIVSGLIGLFFGEGFLAAMWLPAPLPGIGKAGTVLMFDIGVYLTVFATTLLIILSLAEDG